MARQAGSSQIGVGKKLLFSAVAIAIFFVIAEFSVRVWVYWIREEFEKYDVASETFVLVPGTHRAMGDDVLINSDGFVGAELEQDGQDLWRVAAVGDSNTFGGGSPVHSYSAQLERLLDERDVGLRYEVINAGIQGLDSAHALRRLRSKVLPIQPDVVTIYIGWNDLMKIDPFGQQKVNQLSSASRLLDRMWLVKGMRKLVFIEIRPYLDPPSVGPESFTGTFADFRPDFYVDNLKTMIDEVRGIGAKPLLITLPTVLRPDMTIEDVRDARIFFPYYSSAYGVGDLIELVSAYNLAIRRVAVEEGVPVAPLDRVFEAREDYRKLFYDTMHPTTKGNGLIAETLLEVLEREHLLAPSAP